MSVSINYKKDRLVLEGLKCDCPCRHNQPMQDIYVGTGLIEQLPRYIKRRDFLGKKCVMVADPTTYEVAGRDVERVLKAAGYRLTTCILEREGHLEPDESAVGEVLMSMEMDTDFFVSVGSGTVTDSTRIVAAQTERPFVCVGTAPSMDGYTSVVAPLIRRGVQINLKAICPEVIVCDLDILRTAPKQMFAAGVGDVLGKYIAKCDWVIGNIVNGEDYCPTCGGMVIDAGGKLLDNVDEIAQRTEQGARVLIEALLLAGVTIMVVGHTRAVASVEHNIAHYFDMQKLAAHERPASHGDCVGVGTLMVWPAFEQFAKLDPSKIDVERAVRLAHSREERTQFMLDYYGERAARDIMAENEGDFLTEEELRRRVTAIRDRFDEIAAEIALLPPRERIEDAMRRLGAPLTPADIDISDELAARALACGKDYRTRYTLFKSIDEIGMCFEDGQLKNRG